MTQRAPAFVSLAHGFPYVACFAMGAVACAVMAPTPAKAVVVPAPIPELVVPVAVEKIRPVTDSDAARFARAAAFDLGYRVVGLHCAGPVSGVSSRCLLRLRDESGTEELVSWACGPGGACWAASAP